jgi:hypothetical protein
VANGLQKWQQSCITGRAHSASRRIGPHWVNRVVFALMQNFCEYSNPVLQIGSPPMTSSSSIISSDGHNWWQWVSS